MGTQRLKAYTRVLFVSAFLLGTFAYVGPLAKPAAADMLPQALCTYDGRLEPEYFTDGTIVEWICVIQPPRHPFWRIFHILPGPERFRITPFNDDSPPYKSYVNSGIGKGGRNGFGVVSYAIRNPNGTPLNRRIAVRLILKNRTTGGTCGDTGWKEAATPRSNYTYEVSKDLPGTCGGTGYFETSAAGRFFSTSLNAWVTTNWVQSGELRLVPL